MPESPYKVYRTRTGKIRVKYACPNCRDPLENELAEAGTSDTCPACAAEFVVPGIKKKQDVEDQTRRKQTEKQDAEAFAEEMVQAAAEERKDEELQQTSLSDDEYEELQRLRQVRESQAAALKEELTCLRCAGTTMYPRSGDPLNPSLAASLSDKPASSDLPDTTQVYCCHCGARATLGALRPYAAALKETKDLALVTELQLIRRQISQVRSGARLAGQVLVVFGLLSLMLGAALGTVGIVDAQCLFAGIALWIISFS